MGEKRKKSLSTTAQKSDLLLTPNSVQNATSSSVLKDHQQNSTQKPSRKSHHEEPSSHQQIRKSSHIEQSGENPIIVGPFENSILKHQNFSFPQKMNSPSQQQHQQHSQVPLYSQQDAYSFQKQNQLGRVPEFHNSINYYYEFWKMFYTNDVIISKLITVQDEITSMRDRFEKLRDVIQHLDEGASQDQDSKSQMNTTQKIKKKNRRCAGDIQKDFRCPYENCLKTYGSEVSLNLHIKLKHNGGNKTERERLARQIFAAKINGEQIPEMNLNLPPGFMDDIGNGGPKNDYLKPKQDKPLEQKLPMNNLQK